MLRRAIWDKLSERISESFKIARVKQGQLQIFKNRDGDLSPKLPEPSICYWLIALNQQTLCIETNYKSASGQLQNHGQLQKNSVNGLMLVTINRVLKTP